MPKQCTVYPLESNTPLLMLCYPVHPFCFPFHLSSPFHPVTTPILLLRLTRSTIRLYTSSLLLLPFLSPQLPLHAFVSHCCSPSIHLFVSALKFFSFLSPSHFIPLYLITFLIQYLNFYSHLISLVANVHFANQMEGICGFREVI